MMPKKEENAATLEAKARRVFDPSEYPRMLYREGSHLIVKDPVDHKAASKEGWKETQ